MNIVIICPTGYSLVICNCIPSNFNHFLTFIVAFPALRQFPNSFLLKVSLTRPIRLVIFELGIEGIEG